jgi:diaminopimelate decarboxylase
MWWEIKGHFEVKNNELYIGSYSAVELAKRFGTPLYVYNARRVVENYQRFYNTLKKYADREVRVHYSMKANSNPYLLKKLKEQGCWIDAVSPEEVILAINLGFEEKKILFTGSSLSHEDLLQVKPFNIRINADSLSCLLKMKELGMRNEISFRIDPGIRGVGHSWRTITAGIEAHGHPIKFSIPINEIDSVIKLAMDSGFNIKGLHEHVGSNWLTKEEIDEFFETIKILVSKAKEISSKFGINFEFLDLGGGPGIRYRKEQSDFPLEYYAYNIFEILKEVKTDAVAFEPGRYIVADAGILLVKVTEVKKRYDQIIVGVNSGFNHLIRPVLYGSYHEIVNCNNVEGELEEVNIVGNLCETGDIFAAKRKISKVKEGDILAILCAGAYGYSMASRYNLRKLPKELVLDGNKAYISEELCFRTEKYVDLT